MPFVQTASLLILLVSLSSCKRDVDPAPVNSNDSTVADYAISRVLHINIIDSFAGEELVGPGRKYPSDVFKISSFPNLSQYNILFASEQDGKYTLKVCGFFAFAEAGTPIKNFYFHEINCLQYPNGLVDTFAFIKSDTDSIQAILNGHKLGSFLAENEGPYVVPVPR